jgi:hypothetical protein
VHPSEFLAWKRQRKTDEHLYTLEESQCTINTDVMCLTRAVGVLAEQQNMDVAEISSMRVPTPPPSAYTMKVTGSPQLATALRLAKGHELFCEVEVDRKTGYVIKPRQAELDFNGFKVVTSALNAVERANTVSDALELSGQQDFESFSETGEGGAIVSRSLWACHVEMNLILHCLAPSIWRISVYHVLSIPPDGLVSSADRSALVSPPLSPPFVAEAATLR